MVFGFGKGCKDEFSTMSAAAVLDEFNKRSNNFECDGEKLGVTSLLTTLGKIVADMQASGLDVELQPHGSTSEQAFTMFSSNTDDTDVVMSGILKIGSHHKLLAIATEINGKEALQVAMSEFDVRYNSGTKVDADIFDVKADKGALVNLQKEIIQEYANVTYVAKSLQKGSTPSA